MPHLAAAVAAVTLALAADASPIPEIGRVHSSSPACAVLRDVIVPSYGAAQRADARFAEIRIRLPAYIQIADDPAHRSDVVRESALAKLDADATNLLEEAAVINKLLDDARFKASADPQVAAARVQLQQLSAAQSARAHQVQEFVMLERNATVHDDYPGKSRMDRKNKGIEPKSDTLPVGYLAPLNPLPGMPVLTHKTPLADAQALNEWSGSMTAAMRASENMALQSLFPLARSCR